MENARVARERKRVLMQFDSLYKTTVGLYNEMFLIESRGEGEYEEFVMWMSANHPKIWRIAHIIEDAEKVVETLSGNELQEHKKRIFDECNELRNQHRFEMFA